MSRDGRSPRNIRRLVAKRVQQTMENTQQILQSTSGITSISVNFNNTVKGFVQNNLVAEDNLYMSHSSDSNSDDEENGMFSSSSEEELPETVVYDIRDDLKQWALEHNVTGMAIGDLLKILKRQHGFNFLPTDHRTLLNPQITFVKKNIGNGQYCHFGLQNNITKQIDLGFISIPQTPVKILHISFSFDGLPISKSNNNQFWPIQASCLESSFGVFIVGLYYGNTKPNNIEEYLSELVQELLILQNVTTYGKIQFMVKVRCIVADAPARCFVKQCKNHNAYNGCEKCIDPGIWKGRVIFTSVNSPLRTDTDFANQTDKNHHTGISPFVSINLPLVTNVGLDYMHLVCLGVVRKFLRCWVKGPIPYKLSPNQISSLSKALIELSSSCPNEFSRKPRSLKEIDMWKATEYRSFLLYTGPVLLKNVLSKDKYEHFLNLSVAITILISKKCQDPEWNNFSSRLLTSFVVNVSKLYSDTFLVYNVHSLIHLSADVMALGPLDKFSAFEFENNMQLIKRTLRANYKPFEQAINRIREREDSKNIFCRIEHKMIIKTTTGNKCFRLRSGLIGIICKKSQMSDEITFRKFRRLEDFFTRPCKSSLLGIYKVSKLSELVCTKHLNDIEFKCWLVPTNDIGVYISFPLHNL